MSEMSDVRLFSIWKFKKFRLFQIQLSSLDSDPLVKHFLKFQQKPVSHVKGLQKQIILFYFLSYLIAKGQFLIWYSQHLTPQKPPAKSMERRTLHLFFSNKELWLLCSECRRPPPFWYHVICNGQELTHHTWRGLLTYVPTNK
jgi:hypothetical protein